MKYSGMYEFLVKDNDDIIGQLAYAIYKQHKQRVIDDYKKEFKVDEVPEDIMKKFVNVQKNDIAAELYRTQATEVSKAFIKRTNANRGINLDTEYRQKYEKLARSWWYGVTQSLAASFIFVLIGALILKFSGVWDIIVSKIF